MKNYAFIVAAYTALPALNVWDQETEKHFLESLAELPYLDGFEIPFYGKKLQDDRNSSLLRLRPNLKNVLTSIPGTMEQLKLDPNFGLASSDKEGRNKALEFMKLACDMVAKINQESKSIIAVEIHSAPRIIAHKKNSSRDCFLESLNLLSQWDWSGASLHIEHCDSLHPLYEPAKGFLCLEDEQWVARNIKISQKPIGMVINWARSVIEKRSLDSPEKHVSILKNSDQLTGLMFSGTARDDETYGNFLDNHVPFDLGCHPYSTPCSLLSIDRIEKTLAKADLSKLEFIGLKIALSSKINAPAERFAYLEACLQSLLTCINKISPNY